VEVQISPAATTRWVPLESEATVGPAALVTVVRLLHVAPASAEVQTSPPGLVPAAPVTATRWIPVESDATELQPCPDAWVPFVRSVQVAPASAEVQISPIVPIPFMPVTATRRVPVESEATSVQGSPSAAVPAVRSIQVPFPLPDVVPPQAGRAASQHVTRRLVGAR
jgi:hypothetical protein